MSVAAASSEEILRRCQDLVYQVAYAFYDSPYILLLKLLVNSPVVPEKHLCDITLVPYVELRKYLGTLHVHRLIKRYVNKEKTAAESYQRRPNPNYNAPPPQLDAQGNRTKEVAYWYIDYREFADVVKYRIAMMRNNIDEKIKQDVGQRGYICPSCQKIYDPLYLSHLFDPSTNTFNCELDGIELEEYQPPESLNNDDKMQRFNMATGAIRDALRLVEGQRLPSLNVLAWIAQNVKSSSIGEVGANGEGSGAGAEGRKVEVVMGEMGEREKLEKERQAEAQRVQNALPIWHTHSTVTGSATALGLASDKGSNEAGPSRSNKTKTLLTKREEEDKALAEHYRSLEEEEEQEKKDLERKPLVKKEVEIVYIKPEPDVAPVDTEATGVGEDEEMDDDQGGDQSVEKGPVLSVKGVPKAYHDITEADEAEMTEDELQAYFDVASAM